MVFVVRVRYKRHKSKLKCEISACFSLIIQFQWGWYDERLIKLFIFTKKKSEFDFMNVCIHFKRRAAT